MPRHGLCAFALWGITQQVQSPTAEQVNNGAVNGPCGNSKVSRVMASLVLYALSKARNIRFDIHYHIIQCIPVGMRMLLLKGAI